MGIMVPMHKIPNIALGKIGLRHVTRMMFPHLYDKDTPPALPSATVAKIYNEGIRPTVAAICKERLSHWPPSYSAALTNAKDIHGRLHFGTKDLPPYLLDEFASTLRQKLDLLPKLGGMYFMHEVRGTKGYTVHDPDDNQERWTSLERELEYLNFDSIDLKDWFIDVGLEVYLPGHVLQWLEDAHLTLLNFGLPKQGRDHPNALFSLKSDQRKFSTDRVAQLKEFAGFRCMPGLVGRADGVAYLNVYTTDKEPTYQLHRGSFRVHRASELLPMSGGDKLLKEVSEMGTVFGQCIGNMDRAPNEGCARFEIRVTLSQTPQALPTLTHRLLSESLVGIPVALWWSVVAFNVFSTHTLIEFTGSSSLSDW
jgi:hypothetical protein